MKTVLHAVEEMTIEQFADKWELVMEVRERSRHPVGSPGRYYANFEGCSLVEGHFRIGAFGDGPTPDAAIAAYTARISEAVLNHSSTYGQDREIPVPRLIPSAK